MSKAFAWIERLLVCLAIIALIIVFATSIGGSGILVMSIGFLSMLYFVAGYYQSPKFSVGTAWLGAVLRVGSGIAFSIALVGLLFKLMLWEGSSAMLWLGVAGSGGVVLLAYLLHKEQLDLLTVVKRGTVVTLVTLVATLTPSTAFFAQRHRDNPVLVKKYETLYNDPTNAALKAEFQQALQAEFAQKRSR